MPQGKKQAVDRYPGSDQCRNLLRVSDEKMKAVELMIASSGMRVGAFDYLRMKDVKFQENGLLRLRVYQGEDEEYECFASTEAAEALSKYLYSRRWGGGVEPREPGHPRHLVVPVSSWGARRRSAKARGTRPS